MVVEWVAVGGCGASRDRSDVEEGRRENPYRDGWVFFFNDTATTEIYTLSLTRRSSDLRGHQA